MAHGNRRRHIETSPQAAGLNERNEYLKSHAEIKEIRGKRCNAKKKISANICGFLRDEEKERSCATVAVGHKEKTEKNKEK